MRKPGCWLVCALALSTGVADAGAGAGERDAVIWQGTLGTQPIVVEQTTNMSVTSSCGGRYFYRRHRLDIRLEGQATAAGGCTLQELSARWGGDDKNPEWRMQAAVGEQWLGTWVGTNGKTHPIRLRRVGALPEAVEPSLTALRGDFDRYAYMRLSTLRLQHGKREEVNGYHLRWLRQPESRIALFDVAAGYEANSRTAINRTLHRALWQWVEDEHECRSGGGPGEAGFDIAVATFRHIDARVVSVSMQTSYYCGGAHPDLGETALNIDARDGRELRLEDVLWLGQGDAVHEGENELDEAWYQYRQQIFAPWVVMQLKALYPEEMGPPQDEGSCDYRDAEVWRYSAWYVLPTGIHLAAYFPRVMRACDDPDWAVLPWPLVDAHRGQVKLH